MENLDRYGKGRKSVILEMINFCEKEMEKIKECGTNKNTHIMASLSGQVRAYSKIKQKLIGKKKKLKNQKIEN